MKQELKRLLSQRQKLYITDSDRIPAAVLLPLYKKEGEYHILFTKRTEKVTVHKGQISFPGGAYEEGDETLANTALRECAEEIGLPAKEVEILGELDDTSTIDSNYVISPFVAVMSWPYHLKADPTEVEEIITVPISSLLDNGCIHQDTAMLDGQRIITYFFHYQGYVIWGATARILKQFLDIWTQIHKDNTQPPGTKWGNDDSLDIELRNRL